MRPRLVIANLALAAAAHVWLAAVVHADDPAPIEGKQELRTEVARLVQSLDADDFARRARAAQQLADLADKPEHGAALAAELQRVLVAPGTSFEVRTQLQELLKNLPPPAEPSVELTAAEIKRLIDELNSDSYASRLGANQRLDLLLADPQRICPLVVEFKRRLTDPGLNAAARRQLEPAWERVRGAWLLAGCDCKLPPVDDRQIEQWIGTLKSPAPQDGKTWFAHEAAERNLIDLLLLDEYRRKVGESLSRALDESLDPGADQRLRAVYQWTQPAMVAEIWRNQHHVTMQFLLVDVPQFPEGGQRATHFDRIDNQTAHCVSGNSLVPGDYAVNVAIPDPEGRDITFHLVNLPTPRDRMTYSHRVKRDEAVRLRELSQRTCDKLLAEKRSLGELDLLMLFQLDPRVVSRFAGPYLQAVDDSPLPRFNNRLIGQTAHHSLAYVLGAVGTHEAIPGLEEAIQKKRIAEPALDNPWHMAWIGALAIAKRDPWKDVDDWLARLVERELPLVVNADPSPDLGATAAALLLDRHEVTIKPFGIETVGETIMERFGVTPRRFSAPQGRKDVLRWWQQQLRAKAEREAS